MRVRASVGTFAKDVLHFFFPPICTLCNDRLVESDEVICDRCRQELSPLLEPICRRCGNPAAARASDTCNLCRKMKPAFDCARAAVFYRGPAEQLVHELKYNERLELAPVMARIMYVAWQRLLAFDLPDIFIPVPLHSVRQRERGFNQAELLAAPLAALFQKPMVTNAVLRVRPTQTQTRLPLRERMENVEGAFIAVAKSDEGLRDKCVALIDDVCTTGATGNACATALKTAGAGRVILFTFARACME
ncbi:MAG: ComF family protein [Candidatus Sumerlaeia bacterium]|nr:ComF family protein [Candidatus Sumerlaeia bacterium]